MNTKIMTADELIEYLDKCDAAYYNTGRPLVNDSKYDRMKARAKKLNPKHPYFKKVGHSTHGEKVELPSKMGSLQKYRPIDAVEWIFGVQKLNNDYIVTPKFDGLSGLLSYSKGALTNVYTRGDGEYGRSILKFGKLIPSIPHFAFKGIPGDTYIRGEFVIFKSRPNTF
jgi:NAD-dependent DNA ligase